MPECPLTRDEALVALARAVERCGDAQAAVRLAEQRAIEYWRDACDGLQPACMDPRAATLGGLNRRVLGARTAALDADDAMRKAAREALAALRNESAKQPAEEP